MSKKPNTTNRVWRPKEERVVPWVEANPEKVAGYKAKYKANHVATPAQLERKRATSKEWMRKNRAWANAKHKEWVAANPDKVRANKIKTTLKVYGLTTADYDRILGEQGGGCAICGRKDNGGKGRFAVDHDHSKGHNHVRGLLCTHCNVILGMAKDSRVLLGKCMDYLHHHEGDPCDPR